MGPKLRPHSTTGCQQIDRYCSKKSKTEHSNQAGNAPPQTRSRTAGMADKTDQDKAAAAKTGPSGESLGSGKPDTVGDSDKMDMILEGIKNLETKLDTKTKEIIDDFTDKLSKLGDRVDEVSNKVPGLEQSINFAHDEIKDLKEAKVKAENEIEELKKKLDVSHIRSKAVDSELTALKQSADEKANELERHSRKFSIRIHNVPNLPKRKPPIVYNGIVASMLAENDVVEGGPRTQMAWGLQQQPLPDDTEDENTTTTWADLTPEGKTQRTEAIRQEIETSHPIGIRGNQLIVRFFSRPFRDSVLRLARQKLPKGENEVRLTEDLTKSDYALKRKAAPQMRAAYDQGKKTTFRNGKLIIDGNIVPVVF